MSSFVYISDAKRFLPYRDTGVPVHDMGFTRGFGVFEAFLSYSGRIVGFDEHIDRLLAGAKKLGIEAETGKEEIQRIVIEGLRTMEALTVSVKIVLTGGDSSGLAYGGGSRLIVECSEFVPLDPSFYELGIKVFPDPDFSVKRNIKSLDYMDAVISHGKAKAKGYDEALRLVKGSIVEGTNFNIAGIKGKTIVSPKNDVLCGVTMATILELAKREKYKVVHRSITEKDLKTFDECFIASSSREVISVVKVGKVKIGNGVPGPTAKRLHELYKDSIQRQNSVL